MRISAHPRVKSRDQTLLKESAKYLLRQEFLGDRAGIEITLPT